MQAKLNSDDDGDYNTSLPSPAEVSVLFMLTREVLINSKASNSQLHFPI